MSAGIIGNFIEKGLISTEAVEYTQMAIICERMGWTPDQYWNMDPVNLEAIKSVLNAKDRD